MYKYKCIFSTFFRLAPHLFSKSEVLSWRQYLHVLCLFLTAFSALWRPTVREEFRAILSNLHGGSLQMHRGSVFCQTRLLINSNSFNIQHSRQSKSHCKTIDIQSFKRPKFSKLRLYIESVSEIVKNWGSTLNQYLMKWVSLKLIQ